jgi:hypothetical protein
VTSALRLRLNRNALAALALGTWAALIAAVPGATLKLLLAAPIPAYAALRWIFTSPTRWLSVLFFALILLPPLPADFGNSGAHLAPLLVIAGLIIGLRSRTEWLPARDSLTVRMLLFLAIIFASTAFAAIYSGPAIAAGSLARAFLFAIAVYVFLYARAGPRTNAYSTSKAVQWMFICATVGALFASVDFYFQLPAPSGFGPQYVWLDSGVFRRAQGLFYEASTLGNFCAFFITMILVAGFRRTLAFEPWRTHFACRAGVDPGIHGARAKPTFGLPPPASEPSNPAFSRPLLAIGFALFASALLFSYSRASALNVAVAMAALLFLRGASIRRLVLPVIVIALLTGILLRFAAPQFFDHYFIRITASFQQFDQTPDRVLSGRLATWRVIGQFIQNNPLDLIFGIGYKTLPYSNYLGQTLVTDNTYLSLLVETGLIGLAAFLALNAAILRTALKAARSTRENASFLGAWIFCFWCGEMVQMLSGDLITYWRVLPLYFWVLGTAAREESA